MAVRLSPLLTALLVVGALAVGCGGGDDDGSTLAGAATEESASSGGAAESGEAEAGESESGGSESDQAGLTESSLSKEEFVKKASAACNQIRKSLVSEVSAYLKKYASDSTPEQVMIANMAKEVILPTVEAEIAAIRKLGSPAGEEREVEALLAEQEAAIAEVKKLDRAKTLEEVESHFSTASKKLRDYGFTACTNSV